MTEWPVNASTSPLDHPRGWKWVPITDVAQLVTGHTPARSNPDYWNGGVPWINLNEIRQLNGTTCNETQLQISAAGVAKSSAVVHPTGTVCMSRTASVGFVTKMGRPMTTSQDFVNWIPGPEIDSDYLMKALQASRPQILELCSGSTHKTMYVRDAERLRVLLPPVEEQQLIAAVLDAADELRAKRRQALAKLDTLTQAIFIDMFAGDAGRALELRDVADIQGGLQVTAKRQSNPIEVPYLRVANVHRGSLDLSEIKLMRITANELDRTRLSRGDLLVVEGHGNKDEIGRVAVWDGSVDSCVHQNHLIRVRCNPNMLLPRFAEAYMNSWVGRRALLRAANT
ncbi:MAG: restriction endonuclease subunit S, partial [Thermoanaerobaculales bacterium]|nr:restriction endonuclease subunit S [Thermoanaerobaculales bacterium]